METGFKSLKSDPCVYTFSGCGAIDILTLYVDDVLLLGKSVQGLWRAMQKLMSRFSMTDMGDASLVLGMGVTRAREKGTVTITQEKSNSEMGEIFQFLAGAVRHVKLQINVHAWRWKRAVAGPAEGEASKLGEKTAFSGHHGHRNVPWISNSL